MSYTLEPCVDCQNAMVVCDDQEGGLPRCHACLDARAEEATEALYARFYGAGVASTAEAHSACRKIAQRRAS